MYFEKTSLELKDKYNFIPYQLYLPFKENQIKPSIFKLQLLLLLIILWLISTNEMIKF